MRSSANKRKIDDPCSVASAVAASAAVLPGSEIGPITWPLDLDSVCTLVSQPAWDQIGLHARLAFAVLHGNVKGGIDIGKAVSDLLEQGGDEPFEDTLVLMSKTRIALLEIAAMMKVSLSKQWKAVDGYLAANDLPLMGVDDELCDDNELLAFRPVFETGRLRMNAASAAVASAERRYSSGNQKLERAYAVQADAVAADLALVNRIAIMRARTKEGIQFKREVRDYWRDTEQHGLDASIFVDLLAYVEASP